MPAVSPHQATPRARRHPPLRLSALLIAAAGAILLIALVSTDSFDTTITGSGVAATQTRALPAFSAVEVTGTASLSVRIGTPQSVVVRADDNIVGRVSTSVRSGLLTIANPPGRSWTRTPITVAVTIPAVSGLALSGVGDLTVSGLHEQHLTLALDGTGLITASGHAAVVHVSINGSGSADLTRLTARDASAVISGDGQISLTATDTLTASISGTGTIHYFGDPHVSSSVAGTGAVARG